MNRIKYGVPRPFLTEAPSAWISRLALAQRLESIGELLQFLEVPTQRDLDAALVGSALESLRHRCHLPASSFRVHERLMQGVNRCEIDRSKLLLTTAHGAARFRFCPRCLADPHRQFLPIEWRFASWRYCPVHQCLLLDYCPNCLTRMRHPVHLEGSPAARMGYVGLGRCLSCAASLTDARVVSGAVYGWESIAGFERSRYDNGRALLAALYEGEFFFGAWNQKLGDLKWVFRCGLLPVPD